MVDLQIVDLGHAQIMLTLISELHVDFRHRKTHSDRTLKHRQYNLHDIKRLVEKTSWQNDHSHADILLIAGDIANGPSETLNFLTKLNHVLPVPRIFDD
jgi:hypothetical protein